MIVETVPEIQEQACLRKQSQTSIIPSFLPSPNPFHFSFFFFFLSVSYSTFISKLAKGIYLALKAKHVGC